MTAHPSRGAIAVGALALVALASSAYVFVQHKREDPAVPAPAGACSDTEARQEVDRLRRRVAALEAQTKAQLTALLEVSQRVGASDAGAVARAEASAAGETPSVNGRPLYASFKAAKDAVTVTQNRDGTFAVKNTDPALTGQLVQVEAIRPNGAVDAFTVRAPAP